MFPGPVFHQVRDLYMPDPASILLYLNYVAGTSRCVTDDVGTQVPNQNENTA